MEITPWVGRADEVAELRRQVLALSADLRAAYQEYTRLRDLLLENGIPLEAEDDGMECKL